MLAVRAQTSDLTRRGGESCYEVFSKIHTRFQASRIDRRFHSSHVPGSTRVAKEARICPGLCQSFAVLPPELRPLASCVCPRGARSFDRTRANPHGHGPPLQDPMGPLEAFRSSGPRIRALSAPCSDRGSDDLRSGRLTGHARRHAGGASRSRLQAAVQVLNHGLVAQLARARIKWGGGGCGDQAARLVMPLPWQRRGGAGRRAAVGQGSRGYDRSAHRPTALFVRFRNGRSARRTTRPSQRPPDCPTAARTDRPYSLMRQMPPMKNRLRKQRCMRRRRRRSCSISVSG